ncbi:pneumococcal-type histidine triad protein [Granulicatella adiacens ATCC 49175]|uniref:Histidine triad protein n=1 Tax=Granulicatella adiacens ATCC 49175 TaxID=638301 RepID=C8NFW8_9LACT|nr:pneumococcal-type histidine triad protein [Granulicatella adiacens]EEW37454.1 histidine triad protein [Granulicatella adiacens ATCC 49175]UAK93343.1 pneumococcal-type histidine triad protein [Granulicatella adiacens]UWP37660.1 pneumococcal-type histidine triad protein [Granulicatella adiacens ATCC 49175]
MNKKEKVFLGGAVALGLVFASGMILANQQSQVNQVAESTVEQTTISPEQMAKYEQAAKEIKENKPKTIVGEVFENGYLKKHGDHYHFVFGTPPSDAIYEQKKQISQNNHSDDDYVFNPKDIVSENELGFVVRHGDHYHFIYRSQLANAQTVTREDETGKKRTCKLLRIPHGDHFHDVLDCGDGSANYTFDDEPTSHRGGGTSGTVAAASTPSRQHQNSTATTPTVQTSTTDMTTPGDKELTLQSPEIQKYLDYITYAYGVERDSIKFESVTNDQGEYIGKVFAFQNMEQGQDKNHIHPWVIPLKRFEVPNSDPSIPAEVRLSQEIDLIARRMGISRTSIRIVNGRFDIPHGDHSHSMNIVNKDGIEAYEKNKLPGIVPPFVAGDLNEEEVFQKIDEVKTHAQEKYKDDPVTLNRILVALNEYKEQVQQKGNSTEGFVKGLENFEKKVVNKEQDVENSVTPQEQKMNATHEETIRKISELSLKDYGVTADELRDLATKARESGKEAQVNAIASLIQALRDANDRISIEGMRYLYFLTQHVLDQELPAALREEVASLIKRYMGSRLNFGTTAVEALIIESYRTKLAIKEAHKNFNGKVEGTIGKNLKEIMTPASADELSILEEAKDFSEGTLDEADKDNSIPKSSILDKKVEEKSTEATTVSSSTSETPSISTQESTEEKSTSAPETEASTSQEVTTEAPSETTSEPTQK